MHTKIKGLAVSALILTLILSALLCLGALSGDKEAASEEASAVLRLTSDEAEKLRLIDENGKSDYQIIFSSDSLQLDYSLSKEIQTLFAEKGVLTVRIDPDIYVTNPAPHEILIGMTDRSESEEFLGELEAACKNADDIAWGYTVSGEKLLFIGNSVVSYELGQESFIEYLTECDFSVPKDLKVIETMTRADYDAMIEADKEAQYKKRLDELKAKNDAFTQSDFGGAAKDIGDSPYQRPEIYLPKGMHPRLYITEKNLDKVKAIMEDPAYAGLVKIFWDDVNREGCLDGFPTVTFKDPDNKYEDDYYRYDTRIISALQNKAFAYLLTGDEIYGYEAIIGAKNMILTLKYSTYIHMDLYHGASHVMIAVAKIYDWCYHLLSEEDKEQIIAGIANVLGPQMESGMRFPPTGMSAISGHGTGPQFLRDWMMVTIAVCDEVPEWWEFIGGRYFEQYVPAANEYTKEGWVTQGTACYGPGKFYELMNPSWLIYLATGEIVYNVDGMRNSAYNVISHLQANGRWFQTGDGGRNRLGAAVGTNYLYIPSALFGDSVLAGYLYSITDGMNSAANPDWGNDRAAAVVLSFISYFPEPDTDPFSKIDTIQFFDDPAGTTTARSSWSEDAAVAHMKIGVMTMANHDIYDHGTFQIYYKGLLAATSGTYNKYGSNVHKYYLQSTVAHNGILVFNPAAADSEPVLGNDANGNPDPLNVTNGARYFYSGSQERRGEAGTLENWLSGKYNMGVLTGHSEGYDPITGAPEYAYIAGDITSSYSSATVEYLERRMLTVFTGDEKIPMLFLTFDSVESTDPNFEKTYLIHTINEPVVDAEAGVARITAENGSLIVQSLYGTDVMETVGGEGKAYWINGFYKADGTWVEGKNCVDQYAPNDNYKTFWGRLQMRTSGEALSEMLTAMYVTDADNTETRLFEKYENESVMASSFDDIITVFFKDRTRAYKEFSFVSGEEKGLHRYYVSGIDCGTWQILVDGVAVASVYVDNDSAFASFIAPTGEVTFKPGRDVIGANGGRIQYVTGGGILPNDTPYTYLNENDFYLPKVVTRGTDAFLGWYTTENCAPGTEIEFIPKGTLGTVKVYAKWLSVFVNEDYVDVNINHKEASKTVNGINYNGSTKDGSSFCTKTDEDGTPYLEWIEGSKDPLITVTSDVNNFSTMTTEDETVSFEITIARNGDAPIMPMHLRIQSNKEYGTLTDRVFGEARVFTLSSNGKIYLGQSGPLIGDISDGSKVTIRIAVDFKNEMFIAYDKDGFEMQSLKMTIPSKSGAPSGSEWRKLMQQYLAYIYPTGSSDSGGEIRFYDFKISESNVIANKEAAESAITYKSNGGTLEDGAPRYYSKTEDTYLPSITKELSVFDGWYTTETFDESTRIEKITPDTEGPITVYAKWLTTFVDTDFSGTNINATTEANDSLGILGFVTSGKAGASATTKTDENGKSYVEWVKGEADSIVRIMSTSNNFSAMAENVASYSFKLKKKANTSVISTSQILLESNVAYDGTDRVFGSIKLFRIDENGEIFAPNGATLATLTDDKISSVNFSVDFETGTVNYYDEFGGIITTVTFTAPEKSGAPSTLEWKKLIKQYMLYLRADNNSIDPSSALLFYGVTVKEGNMFKSVEAPDGNDIIYRTGGGELPEDAPKQYDPNSDTPLPKDLSKSGYIFAGWYTDPAYKADTRIHFIPSGETKNVTVYAKWLSVVLSEDYTFTEVNVPESTSSTINGIRYNAGSSGELKPGCYHVTETDALGNKYLKSVTAGKSVMAVVMSDSYNLTHFANPAITIELDIAADKEKALGDYSVRISSSGGKYGELFLYRITAATGEVKLQGSDKVIATINSESFATVRVVARFDEAKIYAYGENGEVLDSVDMPEVPKAKDSVVQPTSWLDWQKHSTNYLFYGMLSKSGSANESAVLTDDLVIIDGDKFSV